MVQPSELTEGMNYLVVFSTDEEHLLVICDEIVFSTEGDLRNYPSFDHRHTPPCQVKQSLCCQQLVPDCMQTDMYDGGYQHQKTFDRRNRGFAVSTWYNPLRRILTAVTGWLSICHVDCKHLSLRGIRAATSLGISHKAHYIR
jgi:hypothetical protein